MINSTFCFISDVEETGDMCSQLVVCDETNRLPGGSKDAGPDTVNNLSED